MIITLSANCISSANCTALLSTVFVRILPLRFTSSDFAKQTLPQLPLPTPYLPAHLRLKITATTSLSHRSSGDRAPTSRTRGYAAGGRNQPRGGSPASRSSGRSCRDALLLGGDGNGERRTTAELPTTNFCSCSPVCVKDGFTPSFGLARVTFLKVWSLKSCCRGQMGLLFS